MNSKTIVVFGAVAAIVLLFGSSPLLPSHQALAYHYRYHYHYHTAMDTDTFMLARL